jgi:hypothetical protein
MENSLVDIIVSREPTSSRIVDKFRETCKELHDELNAQDLYLIRGKLYYDVIRGCDRDGYLKNGVHTLTYEEIKK